MKCCRFALHALLRCLFPEAPLEKRATPLPADGESDYNFDYLLALSLQHENSLAQPNVAEAHRELWKNICPPQTGPADHSGQAKNSSGLSQDSLLAADILDRPKSTLLLIEGQEWTCYRESPGDPGPLLSCSGVMVGCFFFFFTEEQRKPKQVTPGGSLYLAEESSV